MSRCPVAAPGKLSPQSEGQREELHRADRPAPGPRERSFPCRGTKGPGCILRSHFGCGFPSTHTYKCTGTGRERLEVSEPDTKNAFIFPLSNRILCDTAFPLSCLSAFTFLFTPTSHCLQWLHTYLWDENTGCRRLQLRIMTPAFDVMNSDPTVNRVPMPFSSLYQVSLDIFILMKHLSSESRNYSQNICQGK